MSIVFLNDHFIEDNEALIPIYDRGIMCNDGFFTTIAVEEGKFLFLDDHIARLHHHAKILDIEIPPIEKKIFSQLLENNQAYEGKWRVKVIITRGGDVSQHLSPSPYGQFMIVMKQIKKDIKALLDLCVFEGLVVTPLSQLKTLSYLPRFWIRTYAHKMNVDDAITIDDNRNILETSFGNIFWIEDGCLYYPNKDLPYFFGVTLKHIIEAAKAIKLKVIEKKITVDELSSQSNVYVSSTLTGLRPVITIDNRAFDRDKKMEALLSESFQKIKKKYWF
jgi:branched-subunit amino acid aminotransferase/4-amino-4-deoxychorismate lyase